MTIHTGVSGASTLPGQVTFSRSGVFGELFDAAPKAVTDPSVYMDPLEKVRRPIAGSVSRFIAMTAVGAATFGGAALLADRHFRDREPQADGTSKGYLDKYEARTKFAGKDGILKYPAFLALLPVGILYNRTRHTVTDKEFAMLRAAYGFLGGGLVATMAAPKLMEPLDPFVQTKLPPASATLDGPIRK